jgi:hypothetical protein
MHRKTITAMLAIVATFAMTATATAHHTPYLSKGKARSMSVQLAKTLNPDGRVGSCWRYSRSHVDCRITQTRRSYTAGHGTVTITTRSCRWTVHVSKRRVSRHGHRVTATRAQAENIGCASSQRTVPSGGHR